jgi:hypothetical protein
MFSGPNLVFRNVINENLSVSLRATERRTVSIQLTMVEPWPMDVKSKAILKQQKTRQS